MKESQQGQKRAQDLRRRVANRRRIVVDSVSSHPMQSLPDLRKSRRETHEIRMQIIKAQSQHNSVLAYCDQQFCFRQLRKGIGASQLQIRQKVEELDGLQRRVLGLSKSLHDFSDEKAFAKTRLMNQEEIRKQLLCSVSCQYCGRDYLSRMLVAHEENCLEKALPRLRPIVEAKQVAGMSKLQDLQSLPIIESVSTSVSVALTTQFVSQPPRNLRIDFKEATHNTLTIRWDLPIFTGSNAVFDYELKFSICHSKRKHDEVQRHYDPQPPLRLSRWCLRNPVPGKMFQLANLFAGQEYGNFTLSAITIAGKSAQSNKVELVQTKPAAPSTAPLFLCAGVVTTSSITLTWMEPMDDGGKPIQDYEVFFLEAVTKLESQDEQGKPRLDKVEYKNRRIRTSGTTLTITGLLSGVDHINFQVRAVNADGIHSDYSVLIKSIFTAAPGNEYKLLDELQTAVNSRSRTVDSRFLSGFMQRYERHHYIRHVSQFIVSIHPDLEAAVNNILSRVSFAIGEDEAMSDQELELHANGQVRDQMTFDERSDKEKVVERRRQFHFRLAEIRNDVKKVEYNVQWCKERQIDLVALIRSAESRILEKQAELERARMFKGPQMDSDVFESGLQRFVTKDLVVALEDEIEIDQLYILDSKAEIVKVGNYLRADIKRRDALLKRLKERHEALEVFESNPNNSKVVASTTSILTKLHGELLYRAFTAFAANREKAYEMRTKIRSAFSRVILHHRRNAFQRWRNVVQFLAQTTAGVNQVNGIGSLGLLNAALDRDNLMNEAHQLLYQLRSTGNSLQDMRWTTEQQLVSRVEILTLDNLADREQDKRYSPFILEGDARMNQQDYDGALRLYSSVLSNKSWVQQMDDKQQVMLQLKFGESTFRLKNYEQALTVFTYASILASRARLRYEEGSAVLRIADTQRALQSLQMSIESYERALLLFEAVRNVQGELSCYRGLQYVYERLEDREMVGINKRLADEIEFVLTNKLSSAGEKMNNLQQRLAGVRAKSSCQIILERVGPIVPRLRRERIQRMLDVREETQLVAKLEDLLRKKQDLLAKGEDDLKRALASDSTQVDSDIIDGSTARYDLDDFKTKLVKLMGHVKAGKEQIGQEIVNAKIRRSNAEDEIRGLEEELAVETGALMRKVLSKDQLRCFRFNTTNEALNNVIGTTSHGITTCFASAGTNGFVFDLLTGACLAQVVGDPRKNHRDIPTGHRAPILSVCYVGHRIYTGSIDASLGVWDVKNEMVGGFSCSLKRMLTDFDTAVVSVVADTKWIACGCSDCDVFVFDAKSLALISHIISAHDRTVTVLALQSANSALTTGAADAKIKVWELGKALQHTTRRNTTLVCCLEAERRGDEFFNGHLVPLTCVKRVANEIVSGDSSGRVAIWNLDADSKLLRICDVHRDVAVTCLQFDATRIVSGSSSGQICVIDFATGSLIQTLLGHQGSVLDLQFDRSRLISMSADGKLCLWFWQARDGVGADRKKYHILGAGETLRSLCFLYRTSVQKLLQWNSIPDSTKLYLGQKLIVGVDASVSASDDLKKLDRSSSVQFGKLSYENLDFIAFNKIKSKDAESQQTTLRLEMLAKEHFPSLQDEATDGTNAKMKEATEAKSKSDLDSAIAMDCSANVGGEKEVEEALTGST